MSLFGKILALLNLLGAAGLVYFATVDYARRQAWAHSYMRHEALLTGLSLDDRELDTSSQPVAERFSENDLAELFKSAGGNPVATQKAELDRVKGILDGKLTSAAQGKALQTSLLSRILLPLTDAYLDREQLLAGRVHFANDKDYTALKTRIKEALSRAMAPGDPDLPEKPLSHAVRTFFHAQPGEPAEMFLALFLDSYRDKDRKDLDRKTAATVNFDQAFDNAVERQRAALEQRYRSLLAEASGSSPDPNEARKQPDMDAQKAAIARLLFGVAPFLAEENVFSDAGSAADKQLLANPASFAEYQQRLIMTEAYKQLINRLLVVCGMRQTLATLSERTTGLRRLNDYVQNSLVQERQQFVNDHNFVIEVIREQANLIKGEQTLINETKDRLTSYTTIVKERQAEIKQVQEEYSKARAFTAQELAKLRDLAQQVHDLRLRVRDAIEANEKGEERIRSLEKQVRDLDRRQDD